MAVLAVVRVLTIIGIDELDVAVVHLHAHFGQLTILLEHVTHVRLAYATRIDTTNE